MGWQRVGTEMTMGQAWDDQGRGGRWFGDETDWRDAGSLGGAGTMDGAHGIPMREVVDSRIRPINTEWSLSFLMGALAKLIVPVLALLGSMTLIAVTREAPVSEAGDIRWATWGTIYMALSLFTIALTNRALGPNFAFAQMLLAWSVAIGVGAALYGGYLETPSWLTLPALREGLALGAGLFLGHVVSIQVFDLTRGVRWYTAPFNALLWGGIVCVLIHRPATAWGSDAPWADYLWGGAVMAVGLAVLFLVPYFFLRGLIKARPGYGGA